MNNVKWPVLVPTLCLVVAALVAACLNLEAIQEAVSAFYSTMANGLSWLFLISDLAAVAFAAWAIFGPCSKVKMGGPDAKADFSLFAWLAMMFTTSCSAGLILFGFIEPLYYAAAPPFELAPFTNTAYETAEMYAHFHWGINVWAIYVPAAVVISFLIYNKKRNTVSIGEACEPVMGKHARGPVGKIIDVLSTFGVAVAPVTSMGLGLPLVIMLVMNILGLDSKQASWVEVAILIVWSIVFLSSVYLGLGKGIKNLSNINVVVAFGYMFAVALLAGLSTVFKAELNSLGMYITNIVRMSTYTDPYGTGEFISSWTVWYFAWITVYMPLMGVLTAKVSKGRTVREIALGLTVVCSLGCFVAIATLGNYSIGIQRAGVDVAAILADEGQAAAIVAIVQTMPFPVLAEIVLAMLCLIFMVTTVDSSSLVAAELTFRHDASTDEAPRGIRILWALVVAAITIVLLMVGGFSAVQTLALLAGFPLAIVQLLIIASGLRLLKGEAGHQIESELNPSESASLADAFHDG